MTHNVRTPRLSPNTASNTTRWARCAFPSTPCTAPRPSVPSRTSRSPDRRWSRRRSPPSHASRSRRPSPTSASACSSSDIADAIACGRRRGHHRSVRRRVPRRRVPDRFGHLVEHEHERGPRDPRHRAPRQPRAPERPRQRLAVLERRVPDLGAHRRHQRSHRRPHPRPRPPRRGLRGQGRAVVRGREGRPHPPHGRHARHPRPGVRRLRPPDAPRHRARRSRRSPASPRFRSAAPPSAPASTPRPASLSSSSSCLQQETELPITEAADHFEAQANRDGLVDASGALRTIAVSLTKICERHPVDGLGSRTPASASSASPTCSPGRRSCRAR